MFARKMIKFDISILYKALLRIETTIAATAYSDEIIIFLDKMRMRFDIK